MEEIEQAAEAFLARIPSYVWDGADAAGPDRGDRRHPRRPAGARRRGPRDSAWRARARPRPGAVRAAATCGRRDLGQRRGGSPVARATALHDRPRARALAASPGRRARRLLPVRIDRAGSTAGSCASPTGRGRGQRVRGRRADAGAAGPGAVRPLRSRLLPAVRHVRCVRRGDGPPAARRHPTRHASRGGKPDPSAPALPSGHRPHAERSTVLTATAPEPVPFLQESPRRGASALVGSSEGGPLLAGRGKRQIYPQLCGDTRPDWRRRIV